MGDLTVTNDSQVYKLTMTRQFIEAPYKSYVDHVPCLSFGGHTDRDVRRYFFLENYETLII